MGGAEHAVMHLLYARFFTKALRDMGFLKHDEPFERLFNQGVMLSENQKISKRSNPLTPEPLVAKYGADTVRCYIMFLGPWDQGGTWTESGINGIVRWLKTVWGLAQPETDKLFSDEKADASWIGNLHTQCHMATKRVAADMERFKFNTAISALMEYCNFLRDMRNRQAHGELTASREAWDTAITRLLLHIAPLAPHIAEELWALRGNQTSIHQQATPQYDESLTQAETKTIPVQVNGRVRGSVEIAVGTDQNAVVELALADANIARWIDGKAPKRQIYVTDKLLNFVVGD
jgi:leucyl-tRNA synthetase